jgi:hypothetical protein
VKADSSILVFNLDSGHSIKVAGRNVFLCYTDVDFYTNESHAIESDITATEIGGLVLAELAKGKKL